MSHEPIEFREDNLLAEYWSGSASGLGFVFAHADAPDFYLHVTASDALMIAGFGLFCAAFHARGERSLSLAIEFHRLVATVRSAMSLNPEFHALSERASPGNSFAEWIWPGAGRGLAFTSASGEERLLRDGPLHVRVSEAGTLIVDKSFRAVGGDEDLLESMVFLDREFLSAMRFALATIASGFTDMDPTRAVRATRQVLADTLRHSLRSSEARALLLKGPLMGTPWGLPISQSRRS